jgi:hypothetical protein
MTEIDPNGWPDPERPGVPENPERDGWHWLHTQVDDLPWFWNAERQHWFDGAGVYNTPSDMHEIGWCYLGVAHTPAEVAAREAAAAEAMRAACAARHDEGSATMDAQTTIERADPIAGAASRIATNNAARQAHILAADAIRALPLPAPDALARVRAEAQEPARRYLINAIIKPLHPDLEPLPDLIGVCTQVDNIIVGVRAEAMREGMERAAGIADANAWRCPNPGCSTIAAAIRAAAQEIKP